MAGAFPAHPKDREHREIITSLIGCGITDFINLVLEDETGMGGRSFRGYIDDYRKAAARKLDPAIHRFPIPDEEVPNESYMIQILDKVDELLKLGRVPYIHCWGGKGRTGSGGGLLAGEEPVCHPEGPLPPEGADRGADGVFLAHTEHSGAGGVRHGVAAGKMSQDSRD